MINYGKTKSNQIPIKKLGNGGIYRYPPLDTRVYGKHSQSNDANLNIGSEWNYLLFEETHVTTSGFLEVEENELDVKRLKMSHSRSGPEERS
jgi:hypothetical protein